jgi:hypothetical protein
MYSSTLSLTSNSNIKQNIPLLYCPCQLLRDIFLLSTKSTTVVVIIFTCIWWVLSSDLNLLHEPSIRNCKGTDFWSWCTHKWNSIYPHQNVDGNKTTKILRKCNKPNGLLCSMSLTFVYVKFPLVDAFSLPPIPHFIINESQERVIE